jgi:hypothetical protein
MRLQKNKSQPEQGRERRQVSPSSGQSPAFSYYNNRRTPDSGQTRQQDRLESPRTGKSRRLPAIRPLFVQAPLWIMLGIAVICVVKILSLSTNPKVIVIGKTSVAANYVQSTDVYAAAAHTILGSALTNRSKLTINLAGTAQSMERQFPELQVVSVGVPLIGSRPVVYIQVANPSLVLQTGNGNYALNKSGIVLAQLRSIPTQIPLVVDQSNQTPKPGKQYLPSSTVAFVDTVAFQLSAAHVDVSTYVLPANAPYELDVRVNGTPYSVRYNLQADPLVQSGAAIGTIQQLGNTVPSSYIDVRVPDRVYYK